jgi:hypothetical protein
MNHITSRMFQAFCITTLLLCGGHAQRSFAQTPTPTPAAGPQFLNITVVSVKPGMVSEFQSLIKDTMNPALKKGGLMWREVWQSTAAGGDAFEYVLVSPVGKLSEYDGPGPLEKGLGAQGFLAWQTKASTMVTSVRRLIVRTRNDLSFEKQSAGPHKLAVVTSIHIAPNRNSEFENYIKNDYMPVMKQAQVTYLVTQTLFGGDANEYVTLTMRDSFADLDKGPVITQTLGEEGAQKLLQKLPAGIVVHVERSLSRFMPDLSFMPAP